MPTGICMLGSRRTGSHTIVRPRSAPRRLPYAASPRRSRQPNVGMGIGVLALPRPSSGHGTARFQHSFPKAQSGQQIQLRPNELRSPESNIASLKLVAQSEFKPLFDGPAVMMLTSSCTVKEPARAVNE